MCGSEGCSTSRKHFTELQFAALLLHLISNETTAITFLWEENQKILSKTKSENENFQNLMSFFVVYFILFRFFQNCNNIWQNSQQLVLSKDFPFLLYISAWLALKSFSQSVTNKSLISKIEAKNQPKCLQRNSCLWRKTHILLRKV